MKLCCVLDYKEDNAQTGNSLAHDARFPTELFWGTFGLVICGAIHITTPPNYTLSWAYGHARGFKQKAYIENLVRKFESYMPTVYKDKSPSTPMKERELVRGELQ